MLVAAAVMGRDFDIPLLEAFGELSGHELRDAIDEATRSHFLRVAGPDRFRFSHDLVRQRVLAGLPLPRLQAYHLAVADTLERSYGKSANERAAEIAYHLYQAGTSADTVRTSTYLAIAATNAMAVGAFDEALRLIERTLQLLPGDKIRERAEALAMRGQAYWGLARNNDAKAAWNGALGRYEELGDTKAVAGIHARLHGIGADGAVAERPKAHERRHDDTGAHDKAVPEPAEPEPAER
jgi:predicted ATPase